MRTYLDHNATSPLRPESARAWAEAQGASIGNPSSLHSEGRSARRLLEQAREQVAALARVPARDVVFTSGGSEAIAAALSGVAARAPGSRRRIVVPSIEHSAVLESASALSVLGFELVTVPCGPSGRIDPERIGEVVDDRVALLCLQAANNETGVLQPVAEAGASARAAGAVFFVDAVQAAGKIPIDRDLWQADLIAISGHKLGGPQGTGALVVREGLAMEPLVRGGAQERRRRGGTEAVAAIAGLGAACEGARRSLDDPSSRLLALRLQLEAGLRAIAPDLRIHGDDAERLSNTTNVAFPGASGETLAIALDLAGFAVSTGSACASGAIEPSHVIRAMGYGDDEARGAVRISLGWSTTEEDVDRFLAALPPLLTRATMHRS